MTIVDAGCPGYRPQLDRALAEIGRSIDGVEAIVLTHAHIDHIGFTQILQDERGIPVHAHEGELPQARTGKAPKTEGSYLPALVRHRRAREVIFHIARNGGARPPKVARVDPFADGNVLDVPGRPTVIATHGHSPGHCVLYVPSEGSAFTGDALCGWNTITGEQGPVLPPRQFNHSTDEARTALDRIESIDAQKLYFGHGDPWTDGAAAAVTHARSRDAGS